MNFQANYPIYLQIAEDIKRRIVIGELKAGDKLSSNAELALAYQVNPNTVQRIYRQLEAEGISYTKRGIGTFLMENPEMPEQLRQEIGEKLSAQFLAQMATYHFSKEEIIHLLEAQAQQQEKEGTSC
ncbi:GntR family transcriptional regulator [Ruminococcus callidus]